MGACGGSPDTRRSRCPARASRSKSVGAVHFYNLNEQGLVRSGRHRQGGHLQHRPAGQRARPGAGGGRLHEPRVLAGARPEPHDHRLVRARHADRRLRGSGQPQAARVLRAQGRPTPGRPSPTAGSSSPATSCAAWTCSPTPGEKGKAWPATSGKADVQRAAVQGGGAAEEPGPCVKGSGGPGGGGKPCAAAPKGARGKRLGRARLGQRRRAVRRAFGRSGLPTAASPTATASGQAGRCASATRPSGRWAGCRRSQRRKVQGAGDPPALLEQAHEGRRRAYRAHRRLRLKQAPGSPARRPRGTQRLVLAPGQGPDAGVQGPRPEGRRGGARQRRAHGQPVRGQALFPLRAVASPR